MAHSLELRQRAVEMYRSGNSTNRIAEQLGVTDFSVNSWVRRAGVSIRSGRGSNCKHSRLVIDACLADYRNGMRLKEIARLRGVAATLVRFWAGEAGIIRPSGRQLQDAETRFWSFVEKSDGCWLWTGGTDAFGYGIFWVRGRNMHASRFSYNLHNEKPLASEQEFACHHCDNPSCVRPEHLFAGDARANSHDMLNKGRFDVKKVAGENNGHAKLTWDNVEAIRAGHFRGLSQTQIGNELGVNGSAISEAVNFKSWKPEHKPNG